ncbi:hypothetical protein ACIBI9_56220 [Nonomuraea sp. NPDC050451]|uniref:hypothetical protein n=1 Tax=Nonomuraea sp. NPDC050451 TaxID=3364364 RepID=UPI0037B57657
MSRSSWIVLRHDLARGAVQRAGMWEYLTEITDAGRERISEETIKEVEPGWRCDPQAIDSNN